LVAYALVSYGFAATAIQRHAAAFLSPFDGHSSTTLRVEADTVGEDESEGGLPGSREHDPVNSVWARVWRWLVRERPKLDDYQLNAIGLVDLVVRLLSKVT
jgi:hypothetical protein